MKRIACLLVAVATAAGAIAFEVPASGRADETDGPISAIQIPAGYRDWRLISVAHEAGNLNDIRFWGTMQRSRPIGNRGFR